MKSEMTELEWTTWRVKWQNYNELIYNMKSEMTELWRHYALFELGNVSLHFSSIFHSCYLSLDKQIVKCTNIIDYNNYTIQKTCHVCTQSMYFILNVFNDLFDVTQYSDVFLPIVRTRVFYMSWCYEIQNSIMNT